MAKFCELSESVDEAELWPAENSETHLDYDAPHDNSHTTACTFALRAAPMMHPNSTMIAYQAGISLQRDPYGETQGRPDSDYSRNCNSSLLAGKLN